MLDYFCHPDKEAKDLLISKTGNVRGTSQEVTAIINIGPTVINKLSGQTFLPGDLFQSQEGGVGSFLGLSSHASGFQENDYIALMNMERSEICLEPFQMYIPCLPFPMSLVGWIFSWKMRRYYPCSLRKASAGSLCGYRPQ